MNILERPASGLDPLLPLARALEAGGGVGCLLLDGALRVMSASPGAAALLGLAQGLCPGSLAADLFTGPGRASLERMAAEALAGGQARAGLLEAGREGSPRLVLDVTVLPVPGEAGDGPALALIARDATARHEETEKLRRGTLEVIRLNAQLRHESTARQLALQALEELSGRLKGVLEAASRVAIVATSVSGVITMFNPGAANLLGHAPEEMEGVQTPLAFLDEDELAWRGRALGQAMGRSFAGMGVVTALARTGRKDFGEWTFVRKDGTRFAAEVALSAIQGPHGVEGYLLVGVDISGRKAAEEAMAEREARLRAILNGAGEGILTVDEAGAIENVNPAAEAMFGYPPGALEGRPLAAIIPGMAAREWEGAAQPCREASGLRGNGERFPLEISMSTVAFPLGTIRTCIVRDITVRRRAEEAKRLYTRRLASQQAALERDLRAAAEIQKGLLPRNLPRDGRYQARWLFEPSAAIGGDIFNILTLGPDHVAAYMLDVSGHGVPSALVAAAAAQALQFHSRDGTGEGGHVPAPEEVLAALDREFPLERFDRYFSLFFLTLDLRTGTLLYSNAGHPSPLLARAGGGISRLDTGGTVIGLGGLMPFERGQAVLSPGDTLALYTDGLTEFESRRGRAFGVKRLERAVSAGGSAGLNEAFETLRADIRRFSGRARPQDDLTVLLMRWAGPDGEEVDDDRG